MSSGTPQKAYGIPRQKPPIYHIYIYIVNEDDLLKHKKFPSLGKRELLIVVKSLMPRIRL